jgi:acetylornithine/N-succinyldiaminopimelate aminotransferase
VPGFRKVRFNDLEQVEKTITPNTVAVMLEPIQGEAGVFVACDEFLQGLRVLAQREGILLILDEIQTGIGRTGKFFGFQHAGVTPDVIALGKGLGGGVPLGALVAREDVCCFDPGDQGGTFNGNALATAVGCAVMEEIAKPSFLPRVVRMGAYLAQRLEALSRKHCCGEVRGKGLLLAMDLACTSAAQVIAAAFARGLLINAPRGDTLRFMPALNVSHDEIDRMIDILDGALKETRAAGQATSC